MRRIGTDDVAAALGLVPGAAPRLTPVGALDHVEPDQRRLYAVRIFLVTVAAHVLCHVLLVWLQRGTGQASGDVFFQHVMLFISFAAIELTALDIIGTTDVRANEG